MRRRLGLVLALLAIPGCRGQEASARLLLLCGAGIRPPVEQMVAEFGEERGVTIECDYGGSGVILTRARLRREGDLFMPGDVRYVEMAEENDLIESSRTACYFVPVILVQAGNPEAIHGVPDLAEPGLSIGLGEVKACAIGKVTDKILSNAGLTREQLGANLRFESLTVNELGLLIDTGHLDAVIVWDAIAASYAESGEIVQIADEHNAVSTVPIAILKSADEPELARDFQSFVVSERGQAIFAEHGYTTQLPE